MIAFRDLQPEALGLFSGASKLAANVDSALAEANDWISREAIDVINVETVGIVSAIEMPKFRTWYRTTSKPAPLPEI